MDCIELTQSLMRINTTNPPGQEAACADFLENLFKKAGFQVDAHDFAPGRRSLVVRRGGCPDKRPLCLCGHLDTVPLGSETWHGSPFEGEVAGDRIFGRGSSDMKGGVAAMVTAALQAVDKLENSPGLVLILTAGEETGFEGASYLASSVALPRCGAMVIGEPTANVPMVGHKGALWLKMRTTGRTAHGSMPEQGDNALYKMARAVLQLEQYVFPTSSHPLLGRPTLNVGTLSGGTRINCVPDRAEMEVDIRTVPGQDHILVREEMQALVGPRVAIETLLSAEALCIDPQHPWVREVFELVTPFLPTPPVPLGVSYFTDGPALIPACGYPPTLILGPGEPSQAHKTDECCSVSLIRNAVEIYRKIILKWCGA